MICPNCGARNFFMHERCRKCSVNMRERLQEIHDGERRRFTAQTDDRRPDRDEGMDVAGFAIGAMTGIPVGPRGVTMAAMMGAAMHQPAQAADEPSPRVENDSYSSHNDGGSSSYSASDSGGSYDGGGSSGGGGE